MHFHWFAWCSGLGLSCDALPDRRVLYLLSMPGAVNSRGPHVSKGASSWTDDGQSIRTVVLVDPHLGHTMPVLLRSRMASGLDAARHQLVKRDNWASENVGVVLVLCIIFIIAVGLIALFAYRKLLARKAARQSMGR